MSGRERILGDEYIIVSKTDLKGRITYANELFLQFSGYALAQTLGAPHNLVRHPHMPRCVFKLLWTCSRAARCSAFRPIRRRPACARRSGVDQAGEFLASVRTLSAPRQIFDRQILIEAI